MPRALIALACLFIAAIVGCSGGGSSSSKSENSGATFSFAILNPVTPSSTKRSRDFTSESTKSVEIEVYSGKNVVAKDTASVAAGSSACTATATGRVCSISVSLSPGSYTTTITNYDGATPSSTELGRLSNVNLTVAKNAFTPFAFVLDGIPKSFVITPVNTRNVRGAQPAGFTVYGGGRQTFSVSALDADGNTILGMGTPTFTETISGASGYSVAPAPTANAFIVTVPGKTGAAAKLTVTGSFADTSICVQPSADCTTSVPLTNDFQTLFIGDGGTGNVQSLAYPYNGHTTKLAISTSYAGYPYAMALDGLGDLFVDDGTHVAVSDAPYSAVNKTIANSGPSPSLAADATGDVFVATTGATSPVTEYSPPYTQAAATITNGVYDPSALALDSKQNLYVANVGPNPSQTTSANGNNVTEYAPPYTGAPAATITQDISGPMGLAFDASNDLFVDNAYSDQITELMPPYSTPYATRPLTYQPNQTAFDYLGNLFLLSHGAAYIYAPPYNGTPIELKNGVSSPVSIAVDDVGDLLVANCPGSPCYVSLFLPPYTADPTVIYTSTQSVDPLTLTLSP